MRIRIRFRIPNTVFNNTYIGLKGGEDEGLGCWMKTIRYISHKLNYKLFSTMFTSVVLTFYIILDPHARRIPPNSFFLFPINQSKCRRAVLEKFWASRSQNNLSSFESRKSFL
jgi:hypothetical protein